MGAGAAAKSSAADFSRSTEYSQRYKDFAEFLTGYGYAVAANDVIGHGESVIPGEEPVHIEKWEHTVGDFGSGWRGKTNSDIYNI